MAETPTRLVVNLTGKSVNALRRLSGDGEMNKTTIVNRAIQIYELAQQFQDNDKPLGFMDDNGQWVRLVIL